MKIEPIQSFSKLKSVFCPKVLCSPRLDRLVVVHDNSRQFFVCELTTGKLLHTERFERHAVLESFHLEERWLFLQYSGQVAPPFDGLIMFDILNCRLLPFDPELQGKIFIGASRHFACLGRWGLGNHGWIAFSLNEGLMQPGPAGVPADKTPHIFGPHLMGIYEQVSEDASRLSLYRMNEQGLPTAELLAQRIRCPILLHYQDKLFVETPSPSDTHQIECLSVSGQALYSMDVQMRREDGFKYRLGLLIDAESDSGTGIFYRERSIVDPKDAFARIYIFKLTAFNLHDGTVLWESDIQHEGLERAFLAGGRILVSDPEGFDVIDVRTGERGRVHMPHVRCASGNGNYLSFLNRAHRGFASPAHNPDFFWQPEEKAPLVMGRIVE